METTTKLRWSRPGSFLLVAAAFLASAAASGVNVGQFDDHLQKRKELAEASAREAYRPDPYNVTNSFNAAVHRHVDRRPSNIHASVSFHFISFHAMYVHGNGNVQSCQQQSA